MAMPDDTQEQSLIVHRAMNVGARTVGGRILGLDGLRALSVVAVVLTHYGLYEGKGGGALLPLVSGTTGVRVFFVLSGFLITRLLLQEYEWTGRISYVDFVARRALRIFPLYILVLTLATVLYLSGWWKTKAGIAGLGYAWVYAYNFVPPELYDPVLAHTWSLAVEEHFYLLWPGALLLFLPRWRLAMFLAALGALACFVSYLVLVRGVALRVAFPERTTIVAAFALFVGCLAALVEMFMGSARFVKTLGSGVGLVVAGLAFAMPALIHSSTRIGSSFLASYVADSLQAIGVAMFVMWLTSNQAGRVVTILETRPLRYIGTISYGIYLWQGLFLAVSPARPSNSAWPPPPDLGLLGIAIFAPISYEFFERRFLALKDRFDPRGAAGRRLPLNIRSE